MNPMIHWPLLLCCVLFSASRRLREKQTRLRNPQQRHTTASLPSATITTFVATTHLGTSWGGWEILQNAGYFCTRLASTTTLCHMVAHQLQFRMANMCSLVWSDTALASMFSFRHLFWKNPNSGSCGAKWALFLEGSNCQVGKHTVALYWQNTNELSPATR